MRRRFTDWAATWKAPAPGAEQSLSDELLAADSELAPADIDTASMLPGAPPQLQEGGLILGDIPGDGVGADCIPGAGASMPQYTHAGGGEDHGGCWGVEEQLQAEVALMYCSDATCFLVASEGGPTSRADGAAGLPLGSLTQCVLSLRGEALLLTPAEAEADGHNLQPRCIPVSSITDVTIAPGDVGSSLLRDQLRQGPQSAAPKPGAAGASLDSAGIHELETSASGLSSSSSVLDPSQRLPAPEGGLPADAKLSRWVDDTATDADEIALGAFDLPPIPLARLPETRSGLPSTDRVSVSGLVQQKSSSRGSAQRGAGRNWDVPLGEYDNSNCQPHQMFRTPIPPLPPSFCRLPRRTHRDVRTRRAIGDPAATAAADAAPHVVTVWALADGLGDAEGGGGSCDAPTVCGPGRRATLILAFPCGDTANNARDAFLRLLTGWR